MARTIAVLGASNTGKSTLVDRMCALEGQPHPAAAPGELRVASFTHLGETWQAIDTPGSIELLHVATDALLAADAAVVCVGPDPAAGAPRLALPARRRGRRHARAPLHQPHRRGDRAASATSSPRCRTTPEHPIVLRQIPIREGGQITGAVDLVSERAWAYREGEPSQLIEIPAGTLDREHEARGELLEHLSEFDDHLLEELIEDQEPPSDEVYALCAKVLRENRVDRGADRLRRPRQRHRPRHEGAPPRGPAPRRPARAPAGAGRPRRAAASPSSSPAPTASTSARPCSCARSSRSPPAAPSAAAPPASSPPPTRATPATSTRSPEGVDRQRGQGRPPRRRPPRHRVRAARHPGLAPAAAADHAAHPRPHLRARQRQALRRARLARRRRRRARSSARTPPPAARWSAPRARCTCASSASASRTSSAWRSRRSSPAPPTARRSPRARRPPTATRSRPAAPASSPTSSSIVAPGAARRRLHLLRGGQGRRRAAELHPRRRAGRPRRHGARPARLPGRRRRRDPHRRPGARRSTAPTWPSASPAARAPREALKAAGPVLLQPVFRVAIHAPALFTGSLGPIVSSHAGQVLGFDADPTAKGWEIFEALVPGSVLGGARQRRPRLHPGRRLVRGRLRPLRGAARQGRRPHRPGARQGAGLTAVPRQRPRTKQPPPGHTMTIPLCFALCLRLDVDGDSAPSIAALSAASIRSQMSCASATVICAGTTRWKSMKVDPPRDPGAHVVRLDRALGMLRDDAADLVEPRPAPPRPSARRATRGSPASPTRGC